MEAVTSHTSIQPHYAVGESHLDPVRRAGDRLAGTPLRFCGMRGVSTFTDFSAAHELVGHLET